MLLSGAWEPQLSQGLSPDQQAMQLYLTQRHCSRGVLSRFLDKEPDWCWCIDGEEICQVCQEPNLEPRPVGVRLGVEAEPLTGFTGPGEVLRQDQVQAQVLDSYEQDLELVRGSCLYCRILRRKSSHLGQACPRRFDWIRAKKEALDVRKQQGRAWIRPYIVCWKCYQPQELCRVADPEDEEVECRFPNIILPLCYGVYRRSGAPAWFKEYFSRSFSTELEYILWLGETASLGGTECIQANCVAARALQEI